MLPKRYEQFKESEFQEERAIGIHTNRFEMLRIQSKYSGEEQQQQQKQKIF